MQRRNKVLLIIVVIVIAALIASPFVLRWYWFFYMEADAEMRAMLPAPPACYVPAGVMVDGSSSAGAKAWDDLNSNGVQDANEPPLRDVVIAMTQEGYAYDAAHSPISWAQIQTGQYDIYETLKVTDNNGAVWLSEFRAGCACDCWKGVALAAWAPPGYKATTPTLVALSKVNQDVIFGFSKVAP